MPIVSIRGKRFLLGVVKKGGYRGVKEKGLGKTIGGNKGGYRRGIFLKVLTRFLGLLETFGKFSTIPTSPTYFHLVKAKKVKSFHFTAMVSKRASFFILP